MKNEKKMEKKKIKWSPTFTTLTTMLLPQDEHVVVMPSDIIIVLVSSTMFRSMMLHHVTYHVTMVTYLFIDPEEKVKPNQEK